MRSLVLRAVLVMPLALGPQAQAQTLRSTVVPADALVVIPPRGQLVPPPVEVARPAPALPELPPLAGAPMGLAAPLVIVPLAAAALLGVGLAGGGGSGPAAPASTR